jgi:hypothetical protein
MARQMPRDGALARAGGAVDGDDDIGGWKTGARRGCIRTHARFFVPCLDWGLG